MQQHPKSIEYIPERFIHQAVLNQKLLIICDITRSYCDI